MGLVGEPSEEVGDADPDMTDVLCVCEGDEDLCVAVESIAWTRGTLT